MDIYFPATLFMPLQELFMKFTIILGRSTFPNNSVLLILLLSRLSLKVTSRQAVTVEHSSLQKFNIKPSHSHTVNPLPAT